MGCQAARSRRELVVDTTLVGVLVNPMRRIPGRRLVGRLGRALCCPRLGKSVDGCQERPVPS